MGNKLIELRPNIDPTQVDADVRAAVEIAGFTQDDVACASAHRRCQVATLQAMFDKLQD